MARWTVEDELDVELEGLEEASIRLVGGEISVTGTEGPPRLQISDVTGSPVEVRFQDGELVVTHEQTGGGRGFLGVFINIGGGGTSPRATVVLTVPATTRLSVASVSADVVVAGLSEPSSVKTVSGDITLKDLSERIEVKTVSGDVEANRLEGDLRFSTVSGDLTMVNGTCTWLSAKTVSGDLTLDLDLLAGGVYDIATVSGDVGMRLHDEPSVTISVSSLSGDLETPWDFGWEEAKPGRRRAHHTVGTGDARLTVKTISGDLRIVRKREAA